MILLPRRVALFFVLLALVSVLGVGILGYRTIVADIPEPDAKAAAELVLFLAIVVAVLMFLALIVVVARTEHISKELDKMVALNRYGDFSPEMSMKRLGKIGEKITLLYFRLNALNEKRSLKISALSDLVQLLSLNIELPILISDIVGEIVYTSRTLGERLEMSRAELLNTTVPQLVPGVDFPSVVMQLDRSNKSRALEGAGRPVTVVPVNNRMDELTYIVWVFSKEGLSVDGTVHPETRMRASGVHGLLRRVFTQKYSRTASPHVGS